MKKVSILLGLMMVLTAGAAFAQAGNNLAWTDCVGSGLEVFDRTLACANSPGIAATRNLIASFVSPVSMTDLGGMQWDADLVTNAPTVNTWWNATGTRWNYAANNPTGAGCVADPWNATTAPSGPVSIPLQQVPSGRPNAIRFFGAQASVAPEVCVVNQGEESYNFTLQLKYSAGTAGDAGCLASACIVLNFIDLQTPTGGSVKLTDPAVQNYVTWRGATGISCPAATPTQKATWGSIKALYR